MNKKVTILSMFLVSFFLTGCIDEYAEIDNYVNKKAYSLLVGQTVAATRKSFADFLGKSLAGTIRSEDTKPYYALYFPPTKNSMFDETNIYVLDIGMSYSIGLIGFSPLSHQSFCTIYLKDVDGDEWKAYTRRDGIKRALSSGSIDFDEGTWKLSDATFTKLDRLFVFGFEQKRSHGITISKEDFKRGHTYQLCIGFSRVVANTAIGNIREYGEKEPSDFEVSDALSNIIQVHIKGDKEIVETGDGHNSSMYIWSMHVKNIADAENAENKDNERDNGR